MATKNQKIAAGFILGSAVIGGVIFLSTRGGTHPPGEKGALAGIVTDQDGQPLDGVSVSLSGFSTVTNQNGIYYIEDIPVGNYTITFTKSGYGTITR